MNVATAVLMTLGAILLVVAFVTAYRFYREPWDELDAEADADPAESGDASARPPHRSPASGQGGETPR